MLEQFSICPTPYSRDKTASDYSPTPRTANPGPEGPDLSRGLSGRIVTGLMAWNHTLFFSCSTGWSFAFFQKPHRGAIVRVSWPYRGALSTILKSKDKCPTNLPIQDAHPPAGVGAPIGIDRGISELFAKSLKFRESNFYYYYYFFK